MTTTDLRQRTRSRAIWVAAAGLVLLVAGLVTLVARYDTYRVSTSAMAPQLHPRDLVLSERDTEPSRGDVVLAEASRWPEVPDGYVFVLRVAAVGGDRIACCDANGRILLNGEPVTEPYATGPNNVNSSFDLIVPEGEVFLLADDRSRGRDSRELVALGRKATVGAPEIAGRVLTVISPPWRLSQVSSAHPTSPHYYALAATAVGLVMFLGAASLVGYRAVRRLAHQLRPKREPIW